MKNIIVIILTLGCLMSCNSRLYDIKEEDELDHRSSELPEVLKIYDSVSKEVEQIYQQDTARVELYLQTFNGGGIQRVPDYNHLPPSFYASINMIRNVNDQIIYISEYPASESGDWDLAYEHYFDTKGNLVAFVRKSSFFNGECADIVHEKSVYFYDSRHLLIKKTYEIVDGDEKKLNYRDCIFNYRAHYVIHKSIDEYFRYNDVVK